MVNYGKMFQIVDTFKIISEPLSNFAKIFGVAEGKEYTAYS